MDPMAIKLQSINMIKQVACGRAHALIISEHDLVFAMGDNHCGQLAVSPQETQRLASPTLIESLQGRA